MQIVLGHESNEFLKIFFVIYSKYYAMMTQVMMKEAWRKSVWQFHRHIHTSASIKVTLFCQFIFFIKFILLRTKTLLHIIINSKLIRLFFTVFVLISTIVNVVIVFNVINQTLEKIHIRASLTDRFS